MIKAILFDFAGVIGTEGYNNYLKVIDPDGKRWDFFQSLANDVDRGDITNKEFLRLVAHHTGDTVEHITHELFEKVSINNHLVTYIKQLKKKYKIGLLSNYTYEWLEEILEKHNLYPLFDAVFISSRHRIIKPDAAAFEKALHLTGVKPEEAVFVDDRQIHVDAANRLGLKGILYTSVYKLKKDFRDLGLTW